MILLRRLRYSKDFNPQKAFRNCSRFLSSKESDSNQTETCELNLVHSPFPDISESDNSPLPEFVTKGWFKSNGKLHNKRAITDGFTGETRTFKEYHHDMRAIASNLKDFGVTEHSTVALFAPNHVDYIPISLGVAMCGSKLTPINPQYKRNELVTVLNKSKSEILICHWSIMDVALEAAKEVKHVKHVVMIPEHENTGVMEGTIDLYSLKKHDYPMKQTCFSVKDVSQHPYLLPYSSGTTGMPKGVCLSQLNMISNLKQYDEVEGMAFPYDHKLISPLPFFHIYGFLASVLYTAFRGQEIITSSGRFDLEHWCKLVEEHRPQRAHLVPPILIGLCKHPVVDKYDLSSLGMILSAAAPLGKETEAKVQSRIGCGIKQAWGMSELSPLALFNSDFNMKSGSVGQLVSNTVAKVVDLETNESLPPNKSGELLIKGPQVMMGYLDEPEKTAECLSPDGWLRTGDIAYYDEDNFFYITDRLKELIKVRGYQVAPAELENLLLTHPNVNDVAIIPVEDEDSGELPKAYIRLNDDELSQAVSASEIQEWVKEKVAPFKRLEGGVEFIDEIPKSSSGKILRRLLVDKEKAAR